MSAALTKLCVLVALSCTTLQPMVCSPPGSSVLGILQTRILEWVAGALLQGIFLTERSNQHLLHFRQILYGWDTREACLLLWHHFSDEFQAALLKHNVLISLMRMKLWTAGFLLGPMVPGARQTWHICILSLHWSLPPTLCDTTPTHPNFLL